MSRLVLSIICIAAMVGCTRSGSAPEQKKETDNTPRIESDPPPSPGTRTPEREPEEISGSGVQNTDGSLEMTFDRRNFGGERQTQMPDRYSIHIAFDKPSGQKPFDASGNLEAAGDMLKLAARKIPRGEGKLKLILKDARDDLYSGEAIVIIDSENIPVAIVLQPLKKEPDRTTADDQDADQKERDDKSDDGADRTSGSTDDKPADDTAAAADDDQAEQSGSSIRRWRGLTLEGMDGWKIKFGTGKTSD